MKSEIEILAETLNDTIEKGVKLDSRPSLREGHELRKGMTHDIWRPKAVGPSDYEIYNPYKWADDGWMPHTGEHWKSQGHKGSYINTDHYYAKYVNLEQKVRGFRGFGKSITPDSINIIKAEVGTKHKYHDGREYLKTDTGWRPVGAGMGDRLIQRDPDAEKELDKHYRSTSTVKTHLKRHEDNNLIRKEMDEQKVKDDKKMRKELQGTFTKKLEKMLDGPMPPEYKTIFDEDKKNAK